MKDLRNKVAVVTGAASGLGKALALDFARRGMKLALADIEVGFSIEQAGQIVSELDALWAHSTRDGKKKVFELRRLHETLTAALAIQET
mgnify:CR=1 FL=1